MPLNTHPLPTRVTHTHIISYVADGSCNTIVFGPDLHPSILHGHKLIEL